MLALQVEDKLVEAKIFVYIFCNVMKERHFTLIIAMKNNTEMLGCFKHVIPELGRVNRKDCLSFDISLDYTAKCCCINKQTNK